jgi:CheY-like chemotaxis protein/HPt (histidine-containing phosphotransfer) domain-containing protein
MPTNPVAKFLVFGMLRVTMPGTTWSFATSTIYQGISGNMPRPNVGTLAEKSVSNSGANSQTILLLDDDQYFRQIQSCILASGGYSIIETQDPKDASLSLKEKKPDLAIVAYKLHGIDGVSWIEHARACGIDVPMVFVSSSNLDEETAERLQKNLNVRLILRKPINLTTFLQEIQAVMPEPSIPQHLENKVANDLEFGIPAPEPVAETGVDSDALLLAIRLELELELKQARMDYLYYTQAELDDILTRAESMDIRNNAMFEEVQRLAHKIRGTAGTFGLTKISRLAENIEACLIQELEPTSDISASVGWLLNDLRSAVRSVVRDCEPMHNVSSTSWS